MKIKIKIILLLSLLIISSYSYGQVRIADSANNTSAANSSAFIDASSNTTYNNSVNMGKGLLFPRLDLTTFTSFGYSGAFLPNNYPTRFDGFIVYNTATSGVAGVGDTEGTLTRGFWYYDNETTDIEGGIWRPLGNCDCCSAFEIASLDCDAVSASIPSTAFTEGESGTELATLLYLSKIGGDAITLANNQSLGSAYGLNIRVDGTQTIGAGTVASGSVNVKITGTATTSGLLNIPILLGGASCGVSVNVVCPPPGAPEIVFSTATVEENIPFTATATATGATSYAWTVTGSDNIEIVSGANTATVTLRATSAGDRKSTRLNSSH